jgi:hypothetical protein
MYDNENIARVKSKLDKLATWKERYEFFVGPIVFNWQIAEEIDAEFMRLAKLTSKEVPFDTYCKSICLMDARFDESHKIWKKFSHERREATYKILCEKKMQLSGMS